MARPKTNDLPPYVKARTTGKGTIYYYQRYGRQIPLGSDYSNAEQRAHAVLAAPPPSPVDDPSEQEIIAKAVTVRRLTGIYFLILNGAIIYVGQAKDVWTRVMQHYRQRRFDSFSWVACPETDLDRLEEHFIAKFNPPQNIARGPVFRTRPQTASASY